MTNGNAAAGAGDLKDVGDAGADNGGGGKLLSDATMVDWPGDCASNRHGTLWGCLRPIRKMDPRPIYFGFWCLMTNTTKLD